MVKKTREEALATRSAILDAAESVFQERGVSKTSLAEIAAAAGVTRGAVYWHFANKVELFDAMVQRVFDLVKGQLDELQNLRQYEDPVDLMREQSIFFLSLIANNPRYYRLIDIFWHKCEYVGEMVEIREKQFERIRWFLDIGVEAFRSSSERGFTLPPPASTHAQPPSV